MLIEVSLLNGFHVPEKEEIKVILPWLQKERKSNILFPLMCVIAVFAGTVVFSVFGILNNAPVLMPVLLIGILLIPSIIIVVKNTLTENEKVKRLKDGDVLITSARVLDTGLKRMARYSYVHCADVEYIDEGHKVTQEFVISKRISKRIKAGDTGYVIKYSAQNNKWLDNKLVFLPGN